ncbi:hypothetical protein TWF225_005200 [Orbilia oligospora]|nr:hypothetical protein TWF225_005200 [Orbilia oligospora]KAF3258135.1 hypothetical protein TWF217_005831 [Orbilia oligospora]KAF3289131.1 hypothetical protein TWF132_007582 [Orbilia oligospora]
MIFKKFEAIRRRFGDIMLRSLSQELTMLLKQELKGETRNFVIAAARGAVMRGMDDVLRDPRSSEPNRIQHAMTTQEDHNNT